MFYNKSLFNINITPFISIISSLFQFYFIYFNIFFYIFFIFISFFNLSFNLFSYAPWCGHCKNLAPEYQKVGESVDKFKPRDTVVAKVNCDEHRAICSKYGVKGFPTLKFFPKGETTPKDYNSGRDASSIVQYLNDEAGTNLRVVEAPTFVQALTPSNFDSVIGKDKNVLIKFYAPWCGHCKKLAPDYEKVAETFAKEQNVVVAKLDADKYRTIGEKYDVKGFPTIKFFKAGSTQPVDYNGGRAPEDFITFLNKECGTSRQLGGLPSEDSGLVSSLSSIASKFSGESDESKKTLLEQAKDKVSSLSNSDKKSGEYYVKVMENILKNSEFVSKEVARLEKIKAGGKISSDQLDWLQIRINILKSF